MKVSGKSASRAPAPATSAASASSLSIVAARSKATGSACTHATLTTSFTGTSLRLREACDELVLGLVVELQVVGSAREDLAPVTIPGRVDQPAHLQRERLGPGGRGAVTKLALGFRHVDEQRFRRRPGRLADLAATGGLLQQDLFEAMARLLADRAGDLQHRRRIGIAAVEDVRPRLRRDQPHKLADVLGRRRVEVPGAPV